MGAVKNIKPTFFGSSIEKGSDVEKTISIGTAKNTEATMATVMMTQLHDTKIETKFNRLILMAQDDQASKIYPLNQNVTHVGRSRSSHVQVADPLVSTKHLSVSVSGNTCVVNDLDSSNGTFINGDRLVGARVLNDGDEILLGKTTLQFAARQMNVSKRPGKAAKPPVKRSNKKSPLPLAKILLCLGISAVIISTAIHITSGRFETRTPLPVEQTTDTSTPASMENAKTTLSPVESNKETVEPKDPTPPIETSHIQRALADYAAGKLYNAKQTLTMLTKAKALTPEGRTAKTLLSKVGIVQELQAQALLAQSENEYAKALGAWESLLTVDMELIGNRPSFFSRQAEKRVQSLSYEYALDAYRAKKHKKASQLCQAILKINPNHDKALALLNRIDSKV